MSEVVRLFLPWPPSINNYYEPRMRRGRFLGFQLNTRARAYRANALAALMEQKAARLPPDEPVALHILFHVPDRRARDIDNPLKGILDALEFAKVLPNDRQVRRLQVAFSDEPPAKPGSVEVEVCPY